MPELVVAGAGMAGMVAAAHARQRGAGVTVREKLARPGGSMRLSSGVISRHSELERFRTDCPSGEDALQRTASESLDPDLDWLQSLGARASERDTGHPLRTGIR